MNVCTGPCDTLASPPVCIPTSCLFSEERLQPWPGWSCYWRQNERSWPTPAKAICFRVRTLKKYWLVWVHFNRKKRMNAYAWWHPVQGIATPPAQWAPDRLCIHRRPDQDTLLVVTPVSNEKKCRLCRKGYVHKEAVYTMIWVSTHPLGLARTRFSTYIHFNWNTV